MSSRIIKNRLTKYKWNLLTVVDSFGLHLIEIVTKINKQWSIWNLLYISRFIWFTSNRNRYKIKSAMVNMINDSFQSKIGSRLDFVEVFNLKNYWS